jgi:hypothetical protein
VSETKDIANGVTTAPASRTSWFQGRRGTLILVCVTIVILLLSWPTSLADAYHRGGFYLFSQDFFEDIPKRLTGPGRFRFILQPLVAIILGIRSGLADAREGRPPYLYALVAHKALRGDLMKSAFETVVNLLLMGVLMDSVFQWFILGASYPGAALVVGPVLILLPYSFARATANRLTRGRRKDPPSVDQTE